MPDPKHIVSVNLDITGEPRHFDDFETYKHFAAACTLVRHIPVKELERAVRHSLKVQALRHGQKTSPEYDVLRAFVSLRDSLQTYDASLGKDPNRFETK